MEHLRNLVNHFKETNPSVPRASEELFVHLEKELLPHLLKIVQRDNTLFTDKDLAPELFPGIKVKWDSSEASWKVVHMALLYSVLHGDPKEKFGKIFELIKSQIPGGTGSDEIMKILEDEDTQDSMKEMLELLMNTRLASVVGDLVSTIKIDDLPIRLDSMEELQDLMRNPSGHPAVVEIMERAQEALKERIETGKINQKELIREIEMLRAKFQSAFGKYMNQMVAGPGNTTGNTAQQIMGNSPEARRARMLARLQRKQQDKSRR